MATPAPRSIAKILRDIASTFAKKNADYAYGTWRSNFDDSAAQQLVDPIDVANMLIAVKQARLKSLSASGRVPANESVRDTLLDRAVYAIIALALYDEDNA